MKKILNKQILVASFIALVFMIVVLYRVQTEVMRGDATITSRNRLTDIVEELEENDMDTEELINQLNSDYIAKAEAFAEMIALDPSIINNAEKLDEINKKLDVDELHVTDEKGVIRWGTVPEYFGFDFATSDQAKEFMPILDDPSIKIAQEAQPNGTEGKYFQYVSVARTDKKGIVQIGNTPERLQSQIEKNSIQNVLDAFKIGNNGYVMAVTKADGLIAAHPNSQLIGTPATDAGIIDEVLKGVVERKYCTVDGERVLCCSIESGDYMLITAMPKSEVYNGRTSRLVVLALAILIMLVVIVVLLNSMVQKVSINGINKILEKMNIISSGNLDVEFDIKTCPEYESLSKGINDMLANIRKNIAETLKLNEEQKRVFEKVTDISANIGSESAEMQDVAIKLSEGSSTQAATVEEVSASFNAISDQIKGNAESARNASNISGKTTKMLDAGAAKLGEMQNAMQKIEESSNKISVIVKTIDDIAFQTNILALNAAVEAARAGQQGKGFAVVADEVRNLANKSAEATKGTASLIDETKLAVAEGARIADETAEQLRSMMTGISESNKIIDGIAIAAEQQAESFEQISGSMLHISDVVQQNAEISANAESTANELDRLAHSLKEIFE